MSVRRNTRAVMTRARRHEASCPGGGPAPGLYMARICPCGQTIALVHGGCGQAFAGIGTCWHSGARDVSGWESCDLDAPIPI